MTNFSGEKKLNDSIIGIEEHGLKIIKQTVIPIVIFYLALFPQSAAVFVIEYFKLDPKITLLTLQFALPVLVGLSAARIFSIYWYAGFQYVAIFFLLILLSPVLLAVRVFSHKTIIRLSEWLKDYELNRKIKSKKETKYLLFNLVLSSVFIISLYVGQHFDNPIGQAWNAKYNKTLEYTANLHYFCQITGAYNQDQCNTWKKKRDDLEALLSSPNASSKIPNKLINRTENASVQN